MIGSLLLLQLSSACTPGQVQQGSDCISICNNAFYNETTQQCDSFTACNSDQILNTTTNQCRDACINGFYESGECKCYAGFILSQSRCAEDLNQNTPTDPTLGLDWFYWGAITIFLINSIYVLTCYCRYRKRRQKPEASTVICKL